MAETLTARPLIELRPEAKGKFSLHHNFHEGQSRVWISKARFIAALAGPQSGKTEMGPPWMHREIYGESTGWTGFRGTAVDGELNDYIAVTANYDLFKLKMLPALLKYFVDVRGHGKYWAGDRILELANPSTLQFQAKRADDPHMWGRIILRSAEAKAGLESGTARAAWLDEADHPDFSDESWEAIQRRLMVHMGRVLFTTTLYRWGFIKRDVYDRWKGGDRDYDVIQFPSITNPAFPREEFERQRRRMPTWRFNMMMMGRYEKPAGLVYSSFSEEKCKIPRRPIPPNWPVFVGHDFGPNNTAAVFYAREPGTPHLIAFAEYLKGGRQLADHVAAWREMMKNHFVFRRVGGSHQEEEIRQGYALAGWPISEPIVRDKQVQIQRVFDMHAQDRIYVFDDLEGYLHEKASFAYKLTEDYERTDQIENESRFHSMAAERYIVSEFTPESANQSGKRDVILTQVM